MNNNERGRITGMPGTKVSVTLYPDRLGVRMRNSIIRMVENRVLVGGWSSQSAMIGKALAAKYGLQISRNNGYGLQVIGINASAAPLVQEILHADWIAWLLDNPSHREGYYKVSYDNAMANLAEHDSDFYIPLRYKESIRKVAVILAEHTTQELKDKSQEVANLLRGTEPIHLLSF